jgi:hypothetical protein
VAFVEAEYQETFRGRELDTEGDCQLLLLPFISPRKLTSEVIGAVLDSRSKDTRIDLQISRFGKTLM